MERGRPSIFTPELAQKILDFVEEGYSIRKIEKQEGMPCRDTIKVWLRDNPDFSVQFAHAHEAAADFRADEVVEIADNDKLDPRDKAVRIDARKWDAGRRNMKKYGKLAGNNINAEVNLNSMTLEQLDQAEAAILAKYGIKPENSTAGLGDSAQDRGTQEAESSAS